jgi:uncharacterized damage-inducible protein DinB
MPMNYEYVAIPDKLIPRAGQALLQSALDTYASETNKVVSVWRCFTDQDLNYRPDPRSRTVLDNLKHQLLSERRFFGEFLAVPEPPPPEVLPQATQLAAYIERTRQLTLPRLEFLARQAETWWLEEVTFFDVVRSRHWIFWRRLLHTCHHRTQLIGYLRMLKRSVPAVYGPTADVTWQGADPTQSVEAAGRKLA